jgi:hypothetical protein
VKAFLASTLLKKLIGPDADFFFDSGICLISMVQISLIKRLRLSRRSHAALGFPQIARGADGGDR